MADRFWVGGSGTWNTSSTTNWSASSGGASGASVPTAADSVFFDQAGTYTVTLTGALTCLDFTVSAGTVTFASSGTPTISGSMSLIAGTNWNGSGTITFNATTTGKTITTNGVDFSCAATFNGVGGGWTLGSAFSVTSKVLTITSGTFDTSSTGNYALTFGNLSSSFATTRVINFNASTITASQSSSIDFSTLTGLTFNAGTSQINITSNQGSISTGGTVASPVVFYNVAFTSTSTGARSITGVNTFNNFAVTGLASAGVTTLTFAANQTINGTLSTTGTAGNRRVFFASANYGIGWTLTCNSAASLTDADFRDLYVIGTAAPISGTRIGNRGNCSGITFSTPKTVYWNLVGGGVWTDTAWATLSGGAVSQDNFPLPQDTATIVNTGLNSGASVSTASAVGYTGAIDLSGRTTAMTFIIGGTPTIYGSWTNSSSITLSVGSAIVFSGDTTKTITSAGKTFGSMTVDTYGGTVQLADALNLGTNSLVVTNGTFNTAGFAVTAGSLASTNSNVRAINLGASTVTLLVNGTAISAANTTNLTFNAGTSQINCSGSSTNIQLANSTGNLVTLYNFSTTNSNNVSISFDGVITFNNITITAPSSTTILPCSFSGNQTINGTLTCAGASAVRRIFLRSDTIGTQRTLTAAAISANDCDFRDILLAGAAAGASPTRAGDCGNNVGITFPAPKTVYWNLAGSQNWSATAWCTGSGGTPAVNNFPLAQDTAVFDNTGSAGTVTIDANWNIGTFDASLRTSAMTITNSGAGQPVIYGNWKFGTGVSYPTGGNPVTFAANVTQTITNNGVSFGGNIIINNPNAYVQLADALEISGTRTLTLTAGTFDAVTYNVTTAAFTNSAATNTLKMGSGTWTLSGTGVVWSCSFTPTLIAGTSTIVLSNTSTTTRTFAGGGLYYNKLTIGGTTGISTLNFSGANTFGEIASTKTVAHTILFSSTTTNNIGKWSVTGTAGNVVTVGPTTAASAYTLIIAGPANTGIDYLSVSYCTVSTTSPGELYVGANSTNTAGNTGSIFFTATPSPRNLYWVGGTGNWSSTTKWATSSGGVSGAAIPMSLDTVTFDSLSNATAYTATIDVGTGGALARCASFTMAGPLTGNVTFAGSTALAFHGNVSFAATGITRTYLGGMFLAGNSSYTFTTNGLTLSSAVTVNGIGSTWTLGSALNIGTSNLAVTYGAFSTSVSNYALNCQAITGSNSNIRSITLNGSTITFGFATSQQVSISTITNLTFDAGTSNIVSSGTVGGLFTGGLTFYNVSFTNPAATSISFSGSGANTFNNLTFTGLTTVGINAVTFNANQTINGTLTLGAGTAASYRTFLASNTIGTPRTLTVNALAAGAADIDFRDIVVTGAAAPLTGTRFGDCKGNSGITFDAAKTVYWRSINAQNWGSASAGFWSATSGGAADATQFPLAQDTAVVPAAYPNSGNSMLINANYNIGTIDMSLRTSNTMTLATGSTTPQIYGNWINGTGTTLSGTPTMTFAGRGSQTITSAGKTFTQNILIYTPSGSVTLQDALTASSSSINVSAGTFDANGYNLTLTAAGSSFTTTGTTLAKTIGIGSGTWTNAGSNGWNTNTSTTITGTGTISFTSASAKTFAGGGISYSGITLNQGGAGALTITGNNTFANITNTSGVATTINLAATTQTVGAFTAAGTAGNLLTVTGTSAGSPATLIYSGSGVISTVDYVVPTFVRAYPTTSTWYAGANSTNGGSLGWIFAASGGVVYAVYITESATALDSISALLPITGAISESTTALDSVAALAAFRSTAAETARATDSIASNATLGSAVSETVNAADATSSIATMGSSVSNTVTVADSAASQQTFQTNISDTVNAADTASSLLVLPGSISEQATAQDTAAAAQLFDARSSESATAQDTVATTFQVGSAVSESVAASDTTSAIKAVFAALAETATVQDSISSLRNLPGSVAESVTAQDASVGSIRFPSNIAESVTAQDSITPALRIGSSISESATASETVSSLRSLPGSISESATAQESVVAKAIFQGIIDEVVRGSDQFSTSVVFLAAFSEFAQAYAESVGYLTSSRSVSESSTAADTTAATKTLPGSISESATGADQSAAALIWAVYISEQAAGLDSLNAPNSTYNATVSNAVAVIDSDAAGAIFYAAVIAYAGVTDVATARYLWELIDDSQTPDWGVINDTQSAGWVEVNDIQAASWQNVGNTQADGWTQIDDTQDPDWVRITP